MLTHSILYHLSDKLAAQGVLVCLPISWVEVLEVHLGELC